MNTQQQYPKEQTDLLQAVYDMRLAQRAYFSQRTDNRLKTAKIKEQRVDALLAPYVVAGAIKPVATTNTVPELFT
jgi:hypothetical protein